MNLEKVFSLLEKHIGSEKIDYDYTILNENEEGATPTLFVTILNAPIYEDIRFVFNVVIVEDDSEKVDSQPLRVNYTVYPVTPKGDILDDALLLDLADKIPIADFEMMSTEVARVILEDICDKNLNLIKEVFQRSPITNEGNENEANS